MIFISRELAPDSPLVRWAEKREIDLRAESFLRFDPVDFTAPTEADWWFYYSPRAVAFAGDPPADVRLAAMGEGTALALLGLIGRVDFCGTGSPERVAEDFLAVAEGRRVFFPRARQSRRSVQTLLAERIEVLDAVCYDNVAISPERPIEAEVYVFTSPLNVRAYLDRFTLRAGSRVIAFGPSTGQALRERGVACIWPDRAGEAAVVELLEKMVAVKE